MFGIVIARLLHVIPNALNSPRQSMKKSEANHFGLVLHRRVPTSAYKDTGLKVFFISKPYTYRIGEEHKGFASDSNHLRDGRKNCESLGKSPEKRGILEVLMRGLDGLWRH